MMGQLACRTRARPIAAAPGTVRTVDVGLVVLIVWLAWPVLSLARPATDDLVASMPVPGGLVALAAAASVPVPLAPERAIVDIARALHERPAPHTVARVLAHLASESGRVETTGEVVPLPLGASFWQTLVPGAHPAEGALVAQVLGDRRLSLLYVALSGLDEPTLGWLSRESSVIGRLTERQAGAFAFVAPHIRMVDDHVRLPGGPEAAPAWDVLLGGRRTSPAETVLTLVSRDRGRLALLVETVAALPPPGQRVALGLDLDHHERVRYLARLARVFRDTTPEWRLDERPFSRPAIDAGRALVGLAVAPDGTLARPRARGFWEARFRGTPTSTGRAAGEADAAWLLERLFDGHGREAAARLDAVQFAEHLTVRQPGLTTEALGQVVDVRLELPALVVVLDRLGLLEAALVTRARDRARALGRDDTGTSLFQGALVLIERATLAGTLNPDRARHLVEGLLARPDDRARDREVVVRWVTTRLLPDLTGRDAASPLTESELWRALAGEPEGVPAGLRPLAQWEGRRYEVAPTAWARDRLERARRRQGPPTLDDVLALDAVIAREASGASALAERFDLVAARLSATAAPAQSVADAHAVAHHLRRLALGGPVAADADRQMSDLRDRWLGDVLVGLAYAPWLGDIGGAARHAGHVARRHDLGLTLSFDERQRVGPWTLPVERRDARGWHVRGAIVGLDGPLTRLRLARLDEAVVPSPPSLADSARRDLLEALRFADSLGVEARGGRALRAAVETGAARVASLARHSGDVAELARALNLAPGRLTGLRWWLAHDGSDLTERFTVHELYRLGRAAEPTSSPLPWWEEVLRGRGPTSLPSVAADVFVWAVAVLDERGLPPSLTAAFLEFVLQAVIDDAQVEPGDDRLGVSVFLQRLPSEVVDDMVAALVADGPLRELADNALGAP